MLQASACLAILGKVGKVGKDARIFHGIVDTSILTVILTALHFLVRMVRIILRLSILTVLTILTILTTMWICVIPSCRGKEILGEEHVMEQLVEVIQGPLVGSPQLLGNGLRGHRAIGGLEAFE